MVGDMMGIVILLMNQVRGNIINTTLLMTAYTIPRQKKITQVVDEQPPVGTYSLANWNKTSRVKTSPRASIGKAPRQSKLNDQLPAPNAYNIPSHHHQPAFSIGKSQRDILGTITQIPPPWQYQTLPQNTHESAPKYSFSKSNAREQLAKEGPSPSQYNPKPITKLKATTFSKEKRDIPLPNQSNPSPQAYLKQKYNRKVSPEYSFTKTNKFHQQNLWLRQKTELPSPGKYNLGLDLASTNGWKFNQSKQLQLKEVGPGPASYNATMTSFYRSPVATIGHSQRSTPRYQTLPGPADYQLPSTNKIKLKPTAPVFGKEKKQPSIKLDSPGVGAYNIAIDEKAACSAYITGRKFYEKKDKIPGPQDYNPSYSQLIENSTKSVIGRDKKLKEYTSESPGPAAYSVDVTKRPKCFSFRKQKDKEVKESDVGPGKYLLKPTLGIIPNSNKMVLYV